MLEQRPVRQAAVSQEPQSSPGAALEVTGLCRVTLRGCLCPPPDGSAMPPAPGYGYAAAQVSLSRPPLSAACYTGLSTGVPRAVSCWYRYGAPWGGLIRPADGRALSCRLQASLCSQSLTEKQQGREQRRPPSRRLAASGGWAAPFPHVVLLKGPWARAVRSQCCCLWSRCRAEESGGRQLSPGRALPLRAPGSN